MLGDPNPEDHRNMSVIHESKRLLLRTFDLRDAEALFDLDSDPEVLRYLGTVHPSSVELYRTWIVDRAQRYDTLNRRLGFWAAIEKDTQRFVGWFHLRPALDYTFALDTHYRERDVDLGYRLRRDMWGRGYATEVSTVLIEHAFKDAMIERVVACALLTNKASVRVLEKVGLTEIERVTLPGYDTPAGVFAIFPTPRILV
ncbi:GNAT family N-acetyltransferase [soil metagenome]